MATVVPYNSGAVRDPVTVHADPNAIRVRYIAPISDKYKCFLTLFGLGTCGCCKAEEALRRTYFEVQENRVEHNMALPILCCVVDRVDALFFDRDLANNVGRAGFCKPWCTHMQCFPTCCDACGEGIVFHGDNGNCYHPAMLSSAGAGACFCKNFSVLIGFADADTLVSEINKAKAEWASRAAPGGAHMR